MNGEEQMNQLPINNSTDKPSKGPMFGVLIVALVIIIGGIYLLASRGDKSPTPSPSDLPPSDSPAGRTGEEILPPPPVAPEPGLEAELPLITEPEATTTTAQ